ncbi:hypothetical protein [Kitasatospora cineracea]|uniref:hypothetical protein n=1 Tax=Kitasatospora cineracea TaxID=88074 RepID=UPI0033C4F28E
MRQILARTVENSESRSADAGGIPAGLHVEDFPTIFTLGPTGTDASHVGRRFQEMRLAGSFPDAMNLAWEQHAAALICAGYVEYANDVTADGWVGLHFGWSGRMELRHVWAEPTKPMVLAVRPGLRASPKSVALHPATRALAERWLPGAEQRYVRAKPLAVELADRGETEACIGSADVVASTGLAVVREVAPVMVWCLYTRADEPAQPRVPVARGAGCGR